tara:strand:- start:110 stop:361 length:252 start_codon:yes stop_codon:yes gene_type:complete
VQPLLLEEKRGMISWLSCLAHPLLSQLFYSFFKSLVGKEITVELKNDLAITGTLVSADQYLNFKLRDIRVVEEDKFPHMVRDR